MTTNQIAAYSGIGNVAMVLVLAVGVVLYLRGRRTARHTIEDELAENDRLILEVDRLTRENRRLIDQWVNDVVDTKEGW